MPRSKGRTGRPWRRVRLDVLASTDVCWLCGHGGARTIDHDPPLHVLEAEGLDPRDPEYLRVAHGSGDYRRPNPCPTCERYCNQVKGGSLTPVVPIIHSRDW